MARFGGTGFYVYMYLDPRNTEVFYVGKGQGYRARKHLSGKVRNIRLRNRILGIRREGLEPQILLVPCESEQDAFAAEKALIAGLGRRELGTGPLCNYTDGGEGSSGRRGFRHTPESRAKISAGTKGRFPNEETRRKISEARKGVPIRISDETRKKIRETQSTAEFRQKLRERAKLQMTPERQAEMTRLAAQATRGKPLSEAHRAKIGAAQIGRTPSDEARRNMSAGQRRRYAK